MISSQTFLLAHLGLIVFGLLFFGFYEGRGRRSFTSRHHGVRYRHITTDEVMKMIEKATKGPSTPAGS